MTYPESSVPDLPPPDPQQGDSPRPQSSTQGEQNLAALMFSRSRYYGEFTPQNLAFNANLQEFSQSVGYICALETGGKLSPQEAYKKVKKLYKRLKKSKKALGIGESVPRP
jgi:hypothetical protein